MKDTDFNIKVTDFIAGKSFEDSIKFSNKFSTSLPQLESGIYCDIDIQGGGDMTILLTIHDLTYTTKPTCDVCSTEYIKQKTHDTFLIKCYADYDEGLLEEDEISFNSKHGVIDLEDLFVQEILLDQSIKKMCSICEKKNNTKPEQISGVNNIKWVL